MSAFTRAELEEVRRFCEEREKAKMKKLMEAAASGEQDRAVEAIEAAKQKQQREKERQRAEAAANWGACMPAVMALPP